MQYFSKTLVLKQVIEGYSSNGKPVSGIARLESEDCFASFHLSLINLCPQTQGCYYSYIMFNKKTLVGVKISNPFSPLVFTIEENYNFELPIAVGVAYIKDGIPALIAFSTEKGANLSVADFKKAILEKIICENKTKNHAPDQKPPVPLPFPKKLPVRPDENPYDDEVVATENYFELDENFSQKLKAVESWEKDYVRLENGKQSMFGAKEDETKKEKSNSIQNERSAFSSKGGKNYFQTIKTQIEQLFSTYPPSLALKNLIPQSRWIEIAYSKDKHYILGVVGETGKERFVCYGVPGEYSPLPPQSLGKNCAFVPTSVFDLHGKGYWLLFQDAISGESVLPEII